MKDSFGREIDYMRISVTDRCNLRCRYCMPTDIDLADMSQILSFEEIVRVAKCGVALGIKNYRITGGEPLVRKDLCKLIKMFSEISGIQSVSLTTNGVLLSRYAADLRNAGIKRINVSLDTVDRNEYSSITGFDLLSEVLEGIDTALTAGIEVRLNAVSGMSDNIKALVEYAERKMTVLRFIELMPIGAAMGKGHISNADIMKSLSESYGSPLKADLTMGNGPAIYYCYDSLKQPVGFISAVSDKFCDSCNRIRLTSMGFLKACLCYDLGEDIKNTIRSGTDEELLRAIERVAKGKPRAHCFESIDNITEKKIMSEIGG